MSLGPVYFRICEGEPLPDITAYAPFRAVVVLDAEYSPEWQDSVSDWLVRSGCLYAMAWGENCSSWDDSIDWANIRMFNPGEIPDESFVVTTWHDDEPLDDVFWFAANCAQHGRVELASTVIVHVNNDRADPAILQRFESARNA